MKLEHDTHFDTKDLRRLVARGLHHNGLSGRDKIIVISVKRGCSVSHGRYAKFDGKPVGDLIEGRRMKIGGVPDDPVLAQQRIANVIDWLSRYMLGATSRQIAGRLKKLDRPISKWAEKSTLRISDNPRAIRGEMSPEAAAVKRTDARLKSAKSAIAKIEKQQHSLKRKLVVWKRKLAARQRAADRAFDKLQALDAPLASATRAALDEIAELVG